MKAEEIEKIIEEGIRETNEIPYIAKLIHDAYEFQHPTPTLTAEMIEDWSEDRKEHPYYGSCDQEYREGLVIGAKYARDFMQSGEADSDFELQRLYDWLMDENRKPANTAFTSGMTRNVAREIEFRLSQSGESPQESKGDGIDLRKELYNFKSFIESKHPNGVVYLSKKVIDNYLSTRQGEDN